MVNRAADCGSPVEWANRQQVFEIEGKIGDFPRLDEIVRTELADVSAADWPSDWQDAPVSAQVSFSWADEARTRPLMTGRLAAGLAVLCQRCLEPFVLRVQTDIDMRLRAASDATAEDSSHEEWEFSGDQVCVADIVEELLVMALPLSAKHDSVDSCGALVSAATRDESRSERPFANLRAQMDRSN